MYMYTHRVFGHLERGLNTKHRMREEWTDTWLSIKSDENWTQPTTDEDTVDRGFVLVGFKPAVRYVQFSSLMIDNQVSVHSSLTRFLMSRAPSVRIPCVVYASHPLPYQNKAFLLKIITLELYAKTCMAYIFSTFNSTKIEQNINKTKKPWTAPLLAYQE